MTTHPFTAADETVEALAEGGTWLLDLVAAVDHLRRGYRPGLTVWDAIAEAVESYVDEQLGDTDLETADPLAAALARLARRAGASAPGVLQVAIRRWVTTMATRYNNGQHWPHPSSRRRFPPPRLEV